MRDVKIKQQLSAIQEAKIMSELEDHPNVIKYHTSFMENDYLHILMEFANRGDLYKVSFDFSYFKIFKFRFLRNKDPRKNTCPKKKFGIMLCRY
jgi:serine/threonine protein kinase